MPPNLSYGLNLPNKNTKKPGPLGQKRKKTIFDDDSDDDQKGDEGEVEISTIGGVGDEPVPSKSQPPKKEPSEPPSKRKPFFTTTTATSGKKTGPKPLSKNSIFADGDDEDNTEERQEANTTGGGLSVPKSQQQKTQADPSKNYTNLSALHSSKKHAQEAQELDPSIYSYDAVYDSLHAKPEQDKKSADKSSEVPKYMTNLLRSAEIRKRDQLRARDRLLAREREAEGEEFADKEKFVTAAYKAQQEEMRRVEAEEAEREKQEEERRKTSGNVGMVGFYRDILSRDEQRHEQVLKATEEAAQRIKTGEPETAETAENKADEDEEKSAARRAADLNAKGAHVAVNDEGQVVDKRQLLSAGLNVAPKPKAAALSAAAAAAAAPASRGPGAPGKRFDGVRSARNDQRARTTEMIAAQLEERAKQEAEAEEAKQKEVAERNKSRKSEKDVSSAKERYLARKKEREAQGGK